MISLERAKTLIDKPEITDQEVIKIRDSIYFLVEIIFEQWESQINRKDKNEKIKKK